MEEESINHWKFKYGGFILHKIVDVKIQPLIAIIKANLMFTKPLLG
jgi:hypothetical protein